jgi:ankyrin repeat protein
MDVEEFKMLLSDLPKALRERIMLVSLSDLDGRGACERVEQLCNDQNDKLLVNLCQSESFFLQLCEQLNWIGPFRKWSDFQSAAFPTDPTIPSKVFAIRTVTEPLSEHTDLMESINIVAVNSILPSRNPSTWFRFMCIEDAEFGPHGNLLHIPYTEPDYYDMLSTYAGKQYPREWICNFTSIAQASELVNYVAQRNDIARMTQLLSIPDMQRYQHWNGSKALTFALNNGLHDMAKVLLRDPNTNPNFTMGSMGQPPMVPLSFVIRQELNDIFDMLLAHPKINVNDVGNAGNYTPLGLCIELMHIEMARKLVAHPGIDVNLESNMGSSPINMAIAMTSPNMSHQFLKLLLTHPDAGVNTLAWVNDFRDGYTPLQLAVQLDDPGSVKILIADPRINVNEIVPGQMTALDVANQHGRKEIAAILKSVGGKSSRNLKMQSCTISANGNMFA